MTDSRRRRVVSIACLGVLFLALVYKLPKWLPFVSGDMEDYIRWMQHILAFGRWHSVEGSFSSYSPPYIYVLALASLLYPHLAAVFVIKLADLPFILLGCGAAWSICRSMGADRFRAGCAAALLFLLPEVMDNTWHWGQSDILHTSMLLWMAAFLMKKQSYAAMAMFGVALAFKLQAILVAPALFALLLTGYVPLGSMLAAGAGYLVMFLPAFLAGRPWLGTFSTYGGQVAEFHSLSMDAPNPYVLIQLLTAQHDAVLARVGIVFAACCALWFVWYTRRQREFQRGIGLMLLLTAPLLFLPYLLPRMHERYFFAGDCFLAIVALVRPRLMLALLLMQVSVLISYAYCLHRQIATANQMLLPLALCTAGLVFVASEIRRFSTRPQEAL